MATTRLTLTPESADFPSSTFAVFEKDSTNGRARLKFDGATDWYCWWQTVIWQGKSGALTAVVYSYAAATGNVTWDVSVEAVSDGESLAAADSFATVNSATTDHTSTNNMFTTSITLTNDDSLAVGDVVRIKLNRDASADANTGNVYVTAVEIREA